MGGRLRRFTHLDYGLLMAVILTSCVDSPPRETLLGIVELNELKEALVRRCFELPMGSACVRLHWGELCQSGYG